MLHVVHHSEGTKVKRRLGHCGICQPAVSFNLTMGDCQRLHDQITKLVTCKWNNASGYGWGSPFATIYRRRDTVVVQWASGFTRPATGSIQLVSWLRKRVAEVVQRASRFRRRVTGMVQRASVLIQRAAEIEQQEPEFRRHFTDILQWAFGSRESAITCRSTSVLIQKGGCRLAHRVAWFRKRAVPVILYATK